MKHVRHDVLSAGSSGHPQITGLSRTDRALLEALLYQPFARALGPLDTRTPMVIAMLPGIKRSAGVAAALQSSDAAIPGDLAAHPGVASWMLTAYPNHPFISDRGGLKTLDAWSGYARDSAGNPRVWENYYETEDGREWSSYWSCQCDDEGISPYASLWAGPTAADEIALWEILRESA